MDIGLDGIPGRLRGTVNRAWGDVTQMSKRAMHRLGIVPPPFRISIDITDRCNFRCPTCSKWRGAPSREELALDEWKLAFEKLRGVPLLREIAIAGGEPFAHPDIFEILELAKQQGLRIVLISNGWFVDAEVLKRVGDIGLDCMMVSLNSLLESVHDESRGTAGSYERIMDLIEIWQSQVRMTDLSLLTIVMEANCGGLVNLTRFVREKGLSGIMFQVLLPTEVHYPFAREPSMPQTAATWYEHDPRWVRSLETLRQQVSELHVMQGQGYPILNPPSQLGRFTLYYEDPRGACRVPCLGTLSRIHIDPLGQLRLCYGYPPIGNILRDAQRHVWRSEQSREIRQASRKCARLCRMLNCNL